MCPLSRQLLWSLSCSSTWTLSQRPAVQSWCLASLIRPPDLRSDASGAGCHSLQRTRRWSTPEGSWASWRTPWLLLKTDSVGVRIRFKLMPILYQLSSSNFRLKPVRSHIQLIQLYVLIQRNHNSTNCNLIIKWSQIGTPEQQPISKDITRVKTCTW